MAVDPKTFMNPTATARSVDNQIDVNNKVEAALAENKARAIDTQAAIRKFEQRQNNIEEYIPPHISKWGHNQAVTESDIGKQFDKFDLNMQFQSNILDNYDTVTYHWKLFIVDPDTFSSGRVFDIEKQTIIVESGVTDLVIDNVRIKSVATPTAYTGTGTSTNFQFDIVEPSGAALMDQLYFQATSLGIGNWTTMPMYLELQFKGRNVTSGEPEGGEPGSLNSLRWFWPIKVTSTKVNVTAVGARYEFTAVRYDDFGLTNNIASLKENITLTRIEKVSDALNELEEKLNASQLLNLLTDYNIPDLFNIIVDPEIADYDITPANKSKNPRRNDNFVKWGDKSATFQTGTSIDTIINTLLSQTQQFQTGLTGTTTPGGSEKPSEEELSGMRSLWRIIPETIPGRYDVRRNDVSKKFTYFVVKYDIGLLSTQQGGTGQANELTKTFDTERRRLKNYVDKSILKKMYNYIFTGLNDQVLNFDIIINNAYVLAKTRTDGIFVNASVSDMGVVAQNYAEEATNARIALRDAMSIISNPKETADSKTESIIRATSAIENANISVEDKLKYRGLLEYARSGDRLNYSRESLNELSDSSLLQARLKAKNLAVPVTERLTDRQFNFISSVDPKSDEALSSASRLAELAKSVRNSRPIASAVTMYDRQVGMGIENNSNSGLQKLSSIFSIALHSGMAEHFQSLKMDIKGDPFWLFPQPIENMRGSIYVSKKPMKDAIDFLRYSQRKIQSVNLYGTDNFFVIRFRSPRMFNNDSSEDASQPNGDVEAYSGVYKVINVTSTFNGGKFTQELNAILDPDIKYLNIQDLIEEAVQKRDRPTLPSDLTGVPEEDNLGEYFSKTDKLKAGTTTTTLNSLGQEVTTITTAPSRTITDTPGGRSIVTDSGGKITITKAAPSIERAASNVPSAVRNTLPGLPDNFS